jgi:hypothetical protein
MVPEGPSEDLTFNSIVVWTLVARPDTLTERTVALENECEVEEDETATSDEPTLAMTKMTSTPREVEGYIEEGLTEESIGETVGCKRVI